MDSPDGLPRGALPSGILKIRKKCPGLKVPCSFHCPLGKLDFKLCSPLKIIYLVFHNLSLISCIEFLQYAPLTDWNFLSVQGIYSAFELDRYERAVLENSWSFLINMISTDLDIIIVCSNSLKSYINSTVRLGITGRLSITGKFEYDLKLTFVWRWYWRCKSMKSLLTVYSPSFLKLDLQFSFNILKSLKSLYRDQQTQTRTKNVS